VKGAGQPAANNWKARPGLAARFKAFLVWLLARMLLATLRVRVSGGDSLQRLRREGPLVYAFWHGRQLALFGAIPERPLAVMASLSRDGQMQAEICRRFGLEVVRGSSSRGGLGGLLGLGRRLRHGRSVALAVDGPRGPAHQAKPGVVALAAASGRPIVPVAVGLRRKLVLRRAWDRFQIPAPFTRVQVAFGEPLQVESAPGSARLEEIARELDRRLRALCDEVDASAVAG